jgi:hypothetical protein
MANTVKERLIAFIEYKGITKNKFETLCGLGKRYVSNISRSISPDVVERISLTFPDLNMGWVMTGEGKMTKEPSVPPSETISIPVEVLRLNLNLTETIRQQQETIQRLTEMLGRQSGSQAPKKESAG